jgi:hypothetical protein
VPSLAGGKEFSFKSNSACHILFYKLNIYIGVPNYIRITLSLTIRIGEIVKDKVRHIMKKKDKNAREFLTYFGYTLGMPYATIFSSRTFDHT